MSLIAEHCRGCWHHLRNLRNTIKTPPRQKLTGSVNTGGIIIRLNVWLSMNLSQCTSLCTSSTFITLWRRAGTQGAGSTDVLCHTQQSQAAFSYTQTHTQTHTCKLWAQAIQDPGRTRSANSNTAIPVIRGEALTRMNLSMQIHPISSDKTPPHV